MRDTILLEVAVEAKSQSALAGAGIVVLDEDELLHSIFAICILILQIMVNITSLNILYFHNFNDLEGWKSAESLKNQGFGVQAIFFVSKLKKAPEPAWDVFFAAKSFKK